MPRIPEGSIRIGRRSPQKTLRNMVGWLASILEVATIDYELLSANPLRGILSQRRRFFPSEALRPRQKRPRILEPEDFKRALSHLPPKVARMVLTAALAGLRWGELVALRIEDEIDFRRNKIHVTRQLYKRAPQTPKTERSERDVDMSPVVRQIMKFAPWSEGLVFSPDGRQAIGERILDQAAVAESPAGGEGPPPDSLARSSASICVAADRRREIPQVHRRASRG